MPLPAVSQEESLLAAVQRHAGLEAVTLNVPEPPTAANEVALVADIV